MSAHESEWTLRRLHAGELPAPDAARARSHAAGCAPCAEALKRFAQVQSQFEAHLPFEHFEAGIEQALERQRAEDRARAKARSRWVAPVVSLAASVLLVVLARPLMHTGAPSNRLKGGAVAELRIGGGEAPQRVVDANLREALRPGERVRLGYTADTHRYVAALSIDATGEVTALYPDAGESLPVEPGDGMHWLPGSLEFTGTGAERVVVLLSDAPLDMDALRDAARRAYAVSGRDLDLMPALDVPGEQTQWTLLKP
ncbi:ACP synthase [Corallococcus sp. H22C18031201]|nr:ACP synthase [Corallococcus sp. H22C18031201]